MKPQFPQKDSDLKARNLQPDSLGFKSQFCHQRAESFVKLSGKSSDKNQKTWHRAWYRINVQSAIAFIAIALHPASKLSVHVPPLKRATVNTFKTTLSN